MFSKTSRSELKKKSRHKCELKC